MVSRLDRLFARIPESALMRAEQVYGGLLKRAANHAIGHVAVTIGHRVLARVIGATGRVTKLTEEQPPVEVARKTMQRFFLPLLDEAPARTGEYGFTFHTCPYGLTGEGGQEHLCRAIMNLEEQLMRELGGELVIDERIADGASHCRFVVRPDKIPVVGPAATDRR